MGERIPQGNFGDQQSVSSQGLCRTHRLEQWFRHPTNWTVSSALCIEITWIFCNTSSSDVNQVEACLPSKNGAKRTQILLIILCDVSSAQLQAAVHAPSCRTHSSQKMCVNERHTLCREALLDYFKPNLPVERWGNQFKYALNVPGNCGSSRLAYQLYSDAAVFLVISEDEEWWADCQTSLKIIILVITFRIASQHATRRFGFADMTLWKHLLAG